MAFASGCATHANVPGPKEAGLPDTPDAWAVDLEKAAPASDWIDQFGSEQLTALIGESLGENFDLAAAAARVEASNASARAAFGRSLPSVNATGSGGTSRTVFEVAGAPQSTDAAVYDWGLSASWEADLWGRVSNTVNAARADLLASEADFAAARLSIAASTATAWISLSNAIAQRDLSEDERVARQRSLALTERRFSSGLSTALDVRLARSAEATARSNIASSEQAVDDASRALETLLGRYPSAQIDAPETLPELPPIQTGGEPADLLARRPDIAAAEARLAASGLRADIARASLRPSLSFSANIGVSDDDYENLFDADYIAGRLLANLAAPIFNGGALKADAESAEAQARVNAATYAQTVLNAWREVEEARSADLSFALQELALEDALVEAQAAEALAERQYQRGLISIFDLIDAQTRRISAERQLTTVNASRAINRVEYHLALGGGGAAALVPNTAPTSPEDKSQESLQP
ncbi:MAG: efflux transporter outer membrane subunit [Pseudomonadota bacterium]